MNDLNIIGFYLIMNFPSGKAIEFQQNSCNVQMNEGRNEINISSMRTEHTIKVADIENGKWTIEGVVEIDPVVFLTFLYENTGNFKSTSGGSGVKKKAVLALFQDWDSNSQTGDPNPSIQKVILNNFDTLPTFVRVGVGTYQIVAAGVSVAYVLSNLTVNIANNLNVNMYIVRFGDSFFIITKQLNTLTDIDKAMDGINSIIVLERY